MSDQNPFEDFDFGEETPSEPQPQEEKPSNRNFLIALGVIGGIFVLVAIALVVVVLFVLPQRNAALREQQQAQLAANTATAFAATENAQQALLLLTPSATPVPPTNTPVIVQPPTATPTLTPTSVSDAQKATLSAQQTQLAAGKFTATVLPTSTALPETGFADEVGLPGMIGIAVALVVIILVARRLRSS